MNNLSKIKNFFHFWKLMVFVETAIIIVILSVFVTASTSKRSKTLYQKIDLNFMSVNKEAKVDTLTEWEIMILAIIGVESEYNAKITRGRSKGVNMWALSQRPATIPNIILANSTHFFVFMLNQFEDRQKMAKATGQSCMMNKIEKYYFWYYNISMDNAVKGTLR